MLGFFVAIAVILAKLVGEKREKVYERLDTINEIKRKVNKNQFIDWILPKTREVLSKKQFIKKIREFEKYGWVN